MKKNNIKLLLTLMAAVLLIGLFYFSSKKNNSPENKTITTVEAIPRVYNLEDIYFLGKNNMLIGESTPKGGVPELYKIVDKTRIDTPCSLDFSQGFSDTVSSIYSVYPAQYDQEIRAGICVFDKKTELIKYKELTKSIGISETIVKKYGPTTEYDIKNNYLENKMQIGIFKKDSNTGEGNTFLRYIDIEY